MGEDRPKVPEGLARVVRQHCAFCCVICGDMPCEIEHIVPWAECRQHELENLALLCDRHHKEVTAGRLSKKAVSQARMSPFGHRRQSAFYQFHQQPMKHVIFGSNLIEAPENSYVRLFATREETVLGFRVFHGAPLYECRMTDQEGNPSLQMIDNTILARSNLWDVKLTGTKFQIYYAERQKVLELFIQDSQMHVMQLRAFSNGVALLITQSGVFANTGAGGASHPIVVQNSYFARAPNSQSNIIATEGVPGSAALRLPFETGYLEAEEAYKWLFSRKPL